MVSSGCIGFLTGSSALTFAANDVRVSERALEDTDYEEPRDTESNVTRTFSGAGETRNVTVTNQVAEYQRSVNLVEDAQPLARATVIASPEVGVAGQTFNPLGDLSDRELAQRLQQQYDTGENVQFQSNRTETVLSEEMTVPNVYESLIQVVDLVETYRDLARGARDIYLNTVSQSTNEVMKMLTVVATLFLPLTFVVGVYGMGFETMPELGWQGAHFAVLLGMALPSVVMLAYFRGQGYL